jgi:hypothetical protein
VSVTLHLSSFLIQACGDFFLGQNTDLDGGLDRSVGGGGRGGRRRNFCPFGGRRSRLVCHVGLFLACVLK